MTTIRMTPKQTATYDHGAEVEQTALMRELREQARSIFAGTGKPVEILTADGIVAEVVQ